MSRQRPSGAGSNSRRLAAVSQPDGSELLVPQVKDAATFIFIAEPDGSWPRRPLTTLLIDAAWVEEGSTLHLEEMRPGHGMGRVLTAQVVDVRVHITIHPGKYGQIKRMLLVDPVVPYEDVMTDRAALEDLT